MYVKLVLDQLIIPLVIFLLILITCLVDIVLMMILSGDILFCSRTGVKGVKDRYSEKLK